VPTAVDNGDFVVEALFDAVYLEIAVLEGRVLLVLIADCLGE
jgi:hypothetical protein